MGDTVYKDIPATNKLFTKAPLTIEQRQRLYRLLHEVLLANSRAEQAGKVMVDLLGTYTTENASEAKEEAQRCIVASLADPNTFLFDHLLNLKPVKFLEGQLIHDLLKIFVFEKLEAYIKFFEANKDFVNGLGLKHEDNVRKMKLLSFMQLAENRSEVSFAEIQHSIQIGEEEVGEGQDRPGGQHGARIQYHAPHFWTRRLAATTPIIDSVEKQHPHGKGTNAARGFSSG